MGDKVTCVFDGEGSIEVATFIEWLEVFQNKYNEEVRLNTNDFNEKSLVIVAMSKSSPLEIVFSGIGVALAAAVIFSGGEVEVSGAKFKLPPLGEGVKSMRIALRDSEDEPDDDLGLGG